MSLISIAPMMGYTDRHFRFLLRLMSSNVFLYTEMLTTAAILKGDRKSLLQLDPLENPIALQLGGCSPRELKECALYAEQFGYNEVNLNIGCPSARVQSGRFGACLMAEPELVAECVATMSNAVHLPITIKTRIGINHDDQYEQLYKFIKLIADAGCKTFVIHARKAWLNGLSPKENRNIPPLRYDVVEQVKADFPHLKIIINGGINTIDQIQNFIENFDGVMIGRAVCQNPLLLIDIERMIFKNHLSLSDPIAILDQYIPYIEKQLNDGIILQRLVKHVFNLFYRKSGANIWRRHLSDRELHKKSNKDQVLYIKNLVNILQSQVLA